MLVVALWGSAASGQTVLFEERFDGGLGQFTGNGRVYTGTYGVRMRGGAGQASVVSDPISTVGFNNIVLTFERQTAGLDQGETGVAAFSTDGSNYTVVEVSSSTLETVSISLGAAASDQGQLFVAFALNASSFFERYEVDDVVVTGIGTAPDPDPDPDPVPDPGNPFQRGPDPTVAVLESDLGPFDVGSYRPPSTPGFGAGTIWYPANTTEGPFAAIAVCPGYLGGEDTIDWVGPRLASNGFVVITISTNSAFDFPSSRADQLVAALATVVSESLDNSPIAGLVDPNRTGVMGHSMGGGGSLIAARDNPGIDAVIPLAPWNNSTTNFSGVQAAGLIVACESDSVAPVGSHALPFYNSLNPEKAFMEFNNEDHFCVVTGNGHEALMGKYIVSWMKAFLDADTRYDPFLCGAPHAQDLVGSELSDYRETCPY